MEALGEWISDQQTQAVFLVDAGLTLWFHNQAARERLKCIEWIQLARRQLEILDPALDSDLKHLLAAWPRQQTARIPVTQGARRLEVAALNVRPPLHAYAIILPPPVAKAVNKALLMKASGLTRAEAEISTLIHEGGNRVSVAKRRGASINTVRAQMKSIFKKLGVRSQLQLVRKISEWAAGR